MTTNCNDTCDAVDKLLLSEISWKQTDMWGSIPPLTRPLPSLIYPSSFCMFSSFQKDLSGAFTSEYSWRYCLAEGVRPPPKKKPSDSTLSFRITMSLLRLSEMASSLESDWRGGWLSKGCRLTPSRFLLKLTNVYDNTNELSSVQKCAFQIPQRFFFFFLYANNFHFNFRCSL